MALKNHQTMVEIGKLLDERAQIKAQDTKTDIDRERIQAIEEEIKTLGKSVGQIPKRSGEKYTAFQTSTMVTSEKEIVSALRAGKSMNYIMRYMRVGYQRISRIMDEYAIERKEG